MRLGGILLAVLGLAGCASQKERAPGPPVTVIDGATLINEYGDAIADSVVTVRGNRIEGAGARGSVTLPKDAVRVDARGLYLIPGLIDLHVHLGSTGGPGFRPENYTRERILKNLNSYLYYGVTTVRSVGTERAEGFEVRNGQRYSPPGTARLFTAGRGFTGPGGPPSQEIGEIARQPRDAEDARQQVRQLAAQEVDLIKIWIDGGGEGHIKPEVVAAIVEEAKGVGIPVHAHVHYLEDAVHFLKVGGSGFLHMIRDCLPCDFDSEFVLELLRKQTVFAPTLVRQELAWLYRDEPERLEEPAVAELVSPETLHEMRQAAKAAKAPSKSQREQYKAARENLKALADQGVPMGVGSDGGSQMDLHGLMTHRECELLAEAGLSPKDVLRAATKSGAMALGKVNDLGTITPGKLADMVLLHANPLESTANLRKIARVMLDGKWVDRGALSLK